MMHPIKLIAISLLMMSTGVFAVTDPACLEHLGGGLSDVECYSGLANDLHANNKEIFLKLKKTIPKGNKFGSLLVGYMRHSDEGIHYCELARQAMNQWVTVNDTPTMVPHHDYDVEYYECVYNARKGEALFLNHLTDLYSDK